MSIVQKKFISSKELKIYSSLKNKKYRDELNLFLIESEKLVLEALKEKWDILTLIVNETMEKELGESLNYFNSFDLKIVFAKKQDFNKLSELQSSPGIIAVVNKKNKSFEKNKPIIALENIQDPGNLGTIIRSADWFGFRNLLASDNCADIYNIKTLRASMGSVFRVNYKENKNFYDYIKELKASEYSIIVSDSKGIELDKANINLRSDKFVLALCNEASGASKNMLNLADYIISIPGDNKAESLNVAMAGSIFFYHLFSLRRK